MKRICFRIGPMLLLVLVLGAAGGCTRHARANRLLRQAGRDFNEEKYDDAEVEYKGVFRLVGMNSLAIGQLGRIYAKEGRILEARAYLAKATLLEPDSLPFQLALGQVDASIHDNTNAARIALRILSAQPTNEEALLLLMNSYGPARALRQAVESLPQGAENPAYHVALGMVALRQRQWDEAENELRLAIQANPKSSQAYLVLAEFYALQRNKPEMVQALKTAGELAPMRSFIRSRYIDQLIENNQVEEARKMMLERSEKAPDYIPGWVDLMHLAMAEKKYDDAAKFADTILSRDERNYEALLARGAVSLEKGDAEKAVEQFERANSIYGKSPQVKYQLATAYLMAHDRIKGVASLDQALALDPGYLQAALLLGQLDIRQGDPAAAVVLMNRFIKKTPGDGQTYMLLAEAYLAEQKPDSAIAVYRHLAEALPKNPQVPLQMGVVLAGQGRDGEARAAFTQALALAPDYMPAVEQLIQLDIAEHNYDDAAALTQEQINKNPKAAEPWEILAKIDVAQNNLAHAETALLKAIDLNPDLPDPYLLLAQVYVHGNNYQEALRKLNSLVARTSDAPADMQIGAIHEQLKEFEPARDAYEKVLSINPDSVPALNNLSYIYAVRLNNIDRAYELAQKARQLMPYNPNVGDTLGWVLFKKGDYPHALTILEDSAEKSPADAEIQFHLGMVHYMMDEEDSARAALQQAVASPQDYVNKDEARTRLAVLNLNTAQAGAADLAELEKELQDHPDDPVVLNRIGAVQEHEGAWEKAAATYETALKQNPGAIPIMAKLARLYALPLNQPEKAMSLATTAHKLAPDNPEVNGVLGHLVYHTGDYVWALSLLENAADQLSGQPDLLYDLAWAYYSVGRMADAETTMQKALQSGPGFDGSEDARQFVALVDALSSPSKAQAAAGLAQKILQADAKYVPALMVSGVAAERTGNFKAAQDAYNQALAIFPLFVPAMRQLAILDAKHFSDDAQGYDLAEKARNAYPDDPAVAESLGIFSYYQGQYLTSADLLQESAGKNINDGELYYYLGMDYYQNKQKQESKEALQRALTFKIPDKLAAAARQALAALK